jgi:hypothetical protein
LELVVGDEAVAGVGFQLCLRGHRFLRLRTSSADTSP